MLAADEVISKQLLAETDEALYQTKKSGRNQAQNDIGADSA